MSGIEKADHLGNLNVRSMDSAADIGAGAEQWPEVAAAQGTHEEVLRLLGAYVTKPSARVLDIPCGAGALSLLLARRGFDMTSMDIHPNDPFYYDASRRVIADANAKLPFPDGHFDAVVSVEGIEHLENPSLFLRECARIVQSSGHVIISTPNVDSIESRRRVYRKGFHTHFSPVDPRRKKYGHLHAIDMIFFRGATTRADLHIEQISVNRVRGRNFYHSLLRRYFTRLLPDEMRGEIPYYGDIIIYVLKK